MFRIKYKIITEQFEKIESISDEEIQYKFLLGNLSMFSTDAVIDIEWEWVPLLDFAYCLKGIADRLKAKKNNKDFFEFTENAETLEFIKEGEQLKIIASFTSTIITTTFLAFDEAVNDFHSHISKHIRTYLLTEPPIVLQKYLSAEA